MTMQYYTANENYFVPRQVFPSPKRIGAETLTVTQTPCASAFLGFGVALTGSSCYLLNQMDPQSRTVLLEDIFSPQRLNLSVARLSIGASDYSAELYSYDDVPFDTTLTNFSIAKDEEYIIPMIKQILQVRPDLYLFSSPWSPPGWMKTGDDMCGGYMRRQYVECYADYFVKYLQAYAAHGIHIRAVTPQNEPNSDQGGRMPACIWHPEIEAAFIKCLRKKLAEAGLDVQIWIHDHNFAGEAQVRWQFKTIEGLKEACGGAAFHYYNDYIEKTLTLKREYPELDLHFTEGGPRLYNNYGTDWCKWMLQILGALRCGYKSFTGWNLMLDENGWPNIGPFSCGGLVTRHSITGQLSYSGQYRAFAHIAKYITPQSRIFPLQPELPAYNALHKFPKAQTLPAEGVLIDNNDGHPVLIMVNPERGPIGTTMTEGRRTQVLVNDQWWYIELLPESVTTIIF